jgi:hypothetical protein
MGKNAEAREELASVRQLQKKTTDKLEQAIRGGHFRDPQVGAGRYQNCSNLCGRWAPCSRS